MTDRHTAYLVTLETPLREDTAKQTLDAIRMVKGVAAVEPVTGEPFVEAAAATRRDIAWQDRLIKLINSGPGGAV